MGAEISNPDRFRKVGDLVPRSEDIVYYAATDLIVFMLGTAGYSIKLLSDESNPPTTIIDRDASALGSWGSGLCAIVPKGNYWLATYSLGTPSVWMRPLSLAYKE